METCHCRKTLMRAGHDFPGVSPEYGGGYSSVGKVRSREDDSRAARGVGHEGLRSPGPRPYEVAAPRFKRDFPAAFTPATRRGPSRTRSSLYTRTRTPEFAGASRMAANNVST